MGKGWFSYKKIKKLSIEIRNTYPCCKVMEKYFRSFREKLDKENISIIQSVEPKQQSVSQVLFMFLIACFGHRVRTSFRARAHRAVGVAARMNGAHPSLWP